MFRVEATESSKTQILYSMYSFFSDNHAVYDIMWKNMVQPDTFVCRITKCTNPPTEYVMLFNGNIGYANAPQYNVLRIGLLLVLLYYTYSDSVK